MADVPQRFLYIQLRADRKRTKVSEKRLSDDIDQAGYKKTEGSVWVKLLLKYARYMVIIKKSTIYRGD